jgi:hypothetical protein
MTYQGSLHFEDVALLLRLSSPLVNGPSLAHFNPNLDLASSYVGKIEKGISVIAKGDGLVWAGHSSQENILAYYQVRSPIAQLLVSMASPDNFSRENIS